jgi:HPr kinase/phosphorylase
MVLRLLDHGFVLVSDDRVEIEDGCARPVIGFAGLLEVRGLGIVRLPHLASARLRLAVSLGPVAVRLPEPASHAPTGLPLVAVDPSRPSAARVVALALDCALGRVAQHAGAFA